jgi:hypothetical protein
MKAQVLGLALCALSTACARPQEAKYVSPADQPAYAERYPAELAGARARYAANEQDLGKLTSEFSKYPDKLNKPSWPAVTQVVEEADRAGKGGDFAAGMAEAESVRSFYEGEKDALRRKVGGAAEHATKQKQCEVELYGPIGGALDRGVEQQLEERLRSRSVAHRTIEDNQDAIGKANVETLEKQADEIALASYIANVRMPAFKAALDNALADASGVKSTLEDEIERADKVAADPSASKNAKDLAEKRKTAASTALSNLDSEVKQAKALSDELEKRNEAAKKGYEKALEDLKKALEEKAKAEPPPADKK